MRDVTVGLEDADGTLGGPSAAVRFTWAGHDENDRQPRDRTVDRRVAALYGARAERDALEKNRARDFGAARELLERCIRRMARYAGDDEEILAILEDLRHKVARYGHDMDQVTRKTLHSSSSFALKERSRMTSSRTVGRVVLLVPRDLARRATWSSSTSPRPTRGSSAWLAFGRALSRWAHDPGAVLGTTDEVQLLDEGDGAAPDAAVRILFSTRPLADNWFSHWHAVRRSAVVSLGGAPASVAVSAEAFVAYEIILHGLRTLGAGWSPERLAHAETRGCLFDFCESREDLAIKLQAADLCPPCRGALEGAGVPMDRLRRLLDVVRTLAVPAGLVH